MAFDRRLMPRPLPAHLASAGFLWLSSRAGLTSSGSGWPLSNAAELRLRDLAGDLARCGPDGIAALDRALCARAEAFLTGVATYRRHGFERADPGLPVRWQEGAARLVDYGRRGHADPVVLVIPSLINRCHVVDLLPRRSFVRQLAAAGLRPLVLDWGEPGPAECDYDLTGYITGPLERALDAAAALAGGPVAVCGYCMGGLLALALALRRQAETAALLLLATPWDFHAERGIQAQLLATLVQFLPLFCGEREPVPPWLVQILFVALDPFLAERKFVRFAALDPGSPAARDFVALEDWLNDGVPLPRNVALECAHSWYRDNDPARGLWHVAGKPVLPADLTAPSLVVVPSRDRIVPPQSAAPLAEALPGATVLRPPFGHIGMMASQAAPRAVWTPIAEWLRSRF